MKNSDLPPDHPLVDYLTEGYLLLRTMTQTVTPEKVLYTCFFLGMVFSALTNLIFNYSIPPIINIKNEMLDLTIGFYLATLFSSLVMLLVFHFREDKKQFLPALGKPVRAGLGMATGLCTWPSILLSVNLMVIYAAILAVIIYVVLSIRPIKQTKTLSEEK